MTANYEKNLFKHNQELIEENEKLKIKSTKVETETANKYLGIIDELKQIAEIQTQCHTTALEHIAKLEAERDRLRKQLNNNSNNSSTPSSNDVKLDAQNTYNSRTKTGKKNVGQKSHS